jgi:hypothetical protein
VQRERLEDDDAAAHHPEGRSVSVKKIVIVKLEADGIACEIQKGVASIRIYRPLKTPGASGDWFLFELAGPKLKDWIALLSQAERELEESC